MARALLQSIAGNRVVPHSAGTESSDVNPLVAKVLSEIGIETSADEPLQLATVFHHSFQYVVTLCDERSEHRPVYPFARHLLKWSVADPEALTTDDPEAQIQAFRQIRNEMLTAVKELIAKIEQGQAVFPVPYPAAA